MYSLDRRPSVSAAPAGRSCRSQYLSWRLFHAEGACLLAVAEEGMSRVEHLAEGVSLWLGDCWEILPTLPRVDAVVTDPPYGIGFKYESHVDDCESDVYLCARRPLSVH